MLDDPVECISVSECQAEPAEAHSSMASNMRISGGISTYPLTP